MKFLIGSLLILGSSLSYASGGHSDVAMELKSPKVVSAGKQTVVFQLVDVKGKKTLGMNDLNVTHEKPLHFLAYDSGLKEFRHEHPEYIDGAWKVDVDLPVNGSYSLWAQGEVAANSKEFSAVASLNVKDGAQAWPAPQLADVRTGTESGSIATLSNHKLQAGKMVMLTLTFTREDGTPAKITPYLGAFAHVVATPADGKSLVHVHPMDGNSPSQGMLHVTFAKAGTYRVWVQFIDNGVLKVVPLSVSVAK